MLIRNSPLKFHMQSAGLNKNHDLFLNTKNRILFISIDFFDLNRFCLTWSIFRLKIVFLGDLVYISYKIIGTK